MAFSGPSFVAALNRVIVFGMLTLLAMQVIPTALAAGSPEAGVFSQKIDANGLTLFVSAAYSRDWSWGHDNTVQVTISRLVGPSNSSALIFYESAVLHRNGSSLVLANSQISSSVPLKSRVGLAKPVDLTFSFSNES